MSNVNRKTPEELKAIREAGGIGDTPLTKTKVPSDKERRAKKATAVVEEAKTSFTKTSGEFKGRVVGEEEGPSAAPKIQSNTARGRRTIVSPQKKLREAGVRSPKNSELRKKKTAVSTTPRKKNRRTTTVVRDAATGRARARTEADFVRTDLPTTDAEARTAAEKVAGVSKPRSIPRASVLTSAPKPAAGPAGNTSEITEMIGQARQHLANMTLSRSKPEEYNAHHDSFNLVHAKLQKVAPAAHTILGIMRHATHNLTPESAGHFEAADLALTDTLKSYKAVSAGNKRSAQAGYQERLRRIKAEGVK